jgi:hypothetical protein
MANPRGNPENLMPPPKPGEVRNPKGHNQYTYRRVFEDAVEKLLVEKHKETGKTYAQILAERALELADKGDTKTLSEVLSRVWPKVSKHELAGSDGEPLTIRWESDDDKS